jgi:uncharacterized protein YjbI with pentapeptide repeats
MKKYTKEELNEILENHKLWLNGDGGSRADLSGANLRGAKLSYSDLRGADLRYSNLRGADLSGANLRHSDLRDTDLRYSDLSGADLRYSDLSGADLSDTDLSGAVGNMDQLKSIFIETYPIIYTSETLQIGCQKHKIEDWWNFDDEKIISMDGKTALKFWRKYKDFIKMTIELSPANPTK